MNSRIRGFVVGATDFGEAHRIVRLLSAEHGRVALLARNARSSSRTFGGLLELGTELDVEVRAGRSDLRLFLEADRLGGPRVARKDLDRIALLAYGCELCSALAAEESPAEKLHPLLRVWLELLEGEGTPGVASRIALEAKALTFAGVTPQLVRCCHCGRDLDEPVVFDPRSGGASHARCGGGHAVSLADLRCIEALRRAPLATSVAAAPPRSTGLLAATVEAQLGRPLRSYAVLASIDRVP